MTTLFDYMHAVRPYICMVAVPTSPSSPTSSYAVRPYIYMVVVHSSSPSPTSSCSRSCTRSTALVVFLRGGSRGSTHDIGSGSSSSGGSGSQ